MYVAEALTILSLGTVSGIVSLVKRHVAFNIA